MEKCSILGILGKILGNRKIFAFLSSLDLISCNFSMIFAHFQTKRGITRGGGKTLQWGGGGNIGAGGGLAPPVYMLKKALLGQLLGFFRALPTSHVVKNLIIKCCTLTEKNI